MGKTIKLFVVLTVLLLIGFGFSVCLGTMLTDTFFPGIRSNTYGEVSPELMAKPTNELVIIMARYVMQGVVICFGSLAIGLIFTNVVIVLAAGVIVRELRQAVARLIPPGAK